MYEYNICTCADIGIYQKQCDAIKEKFPSYSVKTLDDVDGTEISIFSKDDREIRVYNDMYIGAVYVKSTFDLLPYFTK